MDNIEQVAEFYLLQKERCLRARDLFNLEKDKFTALAEELNEILISKDKLAYELRNGEIFEVMQ